MNTSDFEFLRGLLEHKTGFLITPDKSFLLESRLLPVAKKWKCGDISSLVITLRGLPNADLQQDVIDAVMLSETSFLREPKVLRVLRERVLPDLVKLRGGQKRLRVWCAGCSSGQEAYALALLFKEKGLYAQNWQIEIVATDINAAQLERGKQGLYSQFEVQRGLPIRCLAENFVKEGQCWRLSEEMRGKVSFQLFNLLDAMTAMGGFDLILCRGVLNHCPETAQKDILARLTRQSQPKGFLVLAPQEKLDMPSPWQAYAPEAGVFRRS